MLGPALFVPLELARGQVAVADHHPRPAARRLELDHQPGVTKLGRKLGRAPGLHDAPALVDAEEDAMDVSVPGDEPAAGPGLDHRFAATGERGVLPAVHPGREHALWLRGHDGLELEGVGHLPTPDFAV